jgi:queuine tRNA-ribosyltransferase
VIWDVGLGAAANAMAAIECFESLAETGPVRPMHIASFENDLDSLRLAFKNHDRFAYLRHGGPAAILKDGRWQSKKHPGLSWELFEDDFLEKLASASPPDLIFYDMFSGKTSGFAWTLETFEKLHARCAGRDVELFTYSCSTASRVAMLGAGLGVARGRNAGDKEETTIAFTDLEKARQRHRDILGPEWLKKWHRSAAKFPAGLPEDARPAFEARLLALPQFR